MPPSTDIAPRQLAVPPVPHSDRGHDARRARSRARGLLVSQLPARAL